MFNERIHSEKRGHFGFGCQERLLHSAVRHWARVSRLDRFRVGEEGIFGQGPPTVCHGMETSLRKVYWGNKENVTVVEGMCMSIVEINWISAVRLCYTWFCMTGLEVWTWFKSIVSSWMDSRVLKGQLRSGRTFELRGWLVSCVGRGKLGSYGSA